MLFGRGDAAIEFAGLSGGAVVLPGDGRCDGLSRRIHEYVGVDLAAQADGGDTLGPAVGQQFIHDRGDAIAPIMRILLDDAGCRPCRRIGPSYMSEGLASDVEQAALDRRGADIDAKEKIALRHRDSRGIA
jgi:hypothetical protein